MITPWRITVALFLAGCVAFIWWAVAKEVQINTYEKACATAGGVAVKSHLGPRVCVDRDALIEVTK